MADSIGIIILAGGGSRRMGQDKGLMEVNGKSVTKYLIETCAAISEDILIVSHTKAYGQFGFPVVSDILTNIGPLGGLHAGLKQSNHQCNIVLSCDVPLVSLQLLLYLIEQKNASDLAVLAKYQERVHPLIGLYYKKCIGIIENLADQKMHRMSNLYEQKEATILDLSHFPAKEFLNLNTEKELEIFKQYLNDR